MNFVKSFDLYGVRHMTSNIHLLRHFKQAVMESGPLCLTSCFKYEDLNGKLADLIHGTRQAIMQIGTRFELLRDLPLLVDSVMSECARTCCMNFIQKSLNYLSNILLLRKYVLVSTLLEISSISL